MPTAKEVQKKISHKEWKKQISECKSSNLSVKEWCTANGLNHNTYYGRVAALKRDRWEQVAQDISGVRHCRHIAGRDTARSVKMAHNIRKIFKKPLEKHIEMWYNISTQMTSAVWTRQKGVDRNAVYC